MHHAKFDKPALEGRTQSCSIHNVLLLVIHEKHLQTASVVSCANGLLKKVHLSYSLSINSQDVWPRKV